MTKRRPSTVVIKIYTTPSIRKFLKYIAQQERTSMNSFMIENSVAKAKQIYRDMKTTSSIAYDENFNRVEIKPEEKPNLRRTD